MLRVSIKQLALENGFSRAYVFLPERAQRPEINRLNERVADDAREILEDAKCVIILLYPYSAYEDKEDQPLVSAYYVASNSAYHAAKRVANEIQKAGYRAISNAQIAIKPYLLKMGVGETGRNSLISVDGLGTRFHAQIIVTDMPLETDEPRRERGISDLCANCSACVKACPTGAILNGGKIDIERCLRSRDDGEVVPEEIRPLYQNRILGCDVCQDVCPRNGGQKKTEMDEEFSRLISLENLLDGNVKDLSDRIGRNYARRERIRLKAALAAANLKRYDLIDTLNDMAQYGTEKEKVHALWAVEKLSKKHKQE
ncbi:MAG: epoxyqueuosine reductase [Clostridia bacterium]|nr:epoxyqueuosine reductase [Clostridia bacterium]